MRQLIGLAAIVLLTNSVAWAEAPSTVILISLDGFRWDYPEKAPTPHLDRLAREGVRADLIPIFPTKTFPNHYSLVTGLYPEKHGIIANNMYDPVFDSHFSLGRRDEVENGRWWGGEPIWVTVRRQGLRSASMFWPGSEAEISGYRPNYYKIFDSGYPDTERVQQMLAWLDLPAPERPAFICGYFSLTDRLGHDFGPDSPELAQGIKRLDDLIGDLIEALEKRGVLDQVHLILVSDHGMVSSNREQTILLDRILDLDRVEVVDWTPVLALIPEPDYAWEAEDRLRRIPQLQVYRRAQLPERWHLKGHRRVTPLIAVADEGWVITTGNQLDSGPSAVGQHGYDNALRSMQGIFLARGPSFQRGLRSGPVENVDIYGLMCRILGVSPAPNDGDGRSTANLLRSAE